MTSSSKPSPFKYSSEQFLRHPDHSFNKELKNLLRMKFLSQSCKFFLSILSLSQFLPLFIVFQSFILSAPLPLPNGSALPAHLWVGKSTYSPWKESCLASPDVMLQRSFSYFGFKSIFPSRLSLFFSFLSPRKLTDWQNVLGQPSKAKHPLSPTSPHSHSKFSSGSGSMCMQKSFGIISPTEGGSGCITARPMQHHHLSSFFLFFSIRLCHTHAHAHTHPHTRALSNTHTNAHNKRSQKISVPGLKHWQK